MRRSVILCDDDESVRYVLRSALEMAPELEIREAGDGAELLGLLSKRGADLIMLDYHMPNLNGLDALVRLRKVFNQAETAVVMLTANSERDSVKAAAHLGVSGYVLKPFDVAKMKQRVLEALPSRLTIVDVRRMLEACRLADDKLLRDVGGATGGAHEAFPVTHEGVRYAVVVRAPLTAPTAKQRSDAELEAGVKVMVQLGPTWMRKWPSRVAEAPATDDAAVAPGSKEFDLDALLDIVDGKTD